MSTVMTSRSSTLSLFDEQLQAHFRGLHVFRNDRSITCGDNGPADETLSVTETEDIGNGDYIQFNFSTEINFTVVIAV